MVRQRRTVQESGAAFAVPAGPSTPPLVCMYKTQHYTSIIYIDAVPYQSDTIMLSFVRSLHTWLKPAHLCKPHSDSGVVIGSVDPKLLPSIIQKFIVHRCHVLVLHLS